MPLSAENIRMLFSSTKKRAGTQTWSLRLGASCETLVVTVPQDPRPMASQASAHQSQVFLLTRMGSLLSIPVTLLPILSRGSLGA